MADGRWPINFENPPACPAAIGNSKFKIQNSAAFTLIELLVVISIIAVLAAFTIPVMKSLKKQQYIRNAQAEMQQLETALDNYKAKYGAYPPSNTNYYTTPPGLTNSQLPQLFYELSGMTNNNGTYYTLDGGSQLAANAVGTAYGVTGFINCSRGSGEESSYAKNFLSGLSAKQIYYPVTNNFVATTMLVTSVGGPDPNYQPLSVSGQNVPGLNPFRYVYPGVNNPNSYDLWIQLSIGSSFTGVNAFTATNKYLICNWSKLVSKNSPLP